MPFSCRIPGTSNASITPSIPSYQHKSLVRRTCRAGFNFDVHLWARYPNRSLWVSFPNLLSSRRDAKIFSVLCSVSKSRTSLSSWPNASLRVPVEVPNTPHDARSDCIALFKRELLTRIINHALPSRPKQIWFR